MAAFLAGGDAAKARRQRAGLDISRSSEHWAVGALVQQGSANGVPMLDIADEGPFFHGTVAALRGGDLLVAGYRSNYRPEVIMNHIYFTALVDGAGLAAEIAAELNGGRAIPRVYVVEPTGAFENDPNVTDKKFPGNPTRSYRSSAPLKVIGEVAEWTRMTPEAMQAWKERLTALLSDKRAQIIN